MSDGQDDELDPFFYTPGVKADGARQPTPGFKQWEFRKGDRVMACEFRD